MTAKPSTAVAQRPASPTDADAVVADLVAAAKTPQDRERMYALADAVTQSRLMRRTSQLIAATEWGATWSEPKRIAFGRYCLALGADPLRHVDLLGGNPFVNGDYYRDVIAANPHFVNSEDPRWIHDDPRLQLCVACGKPFAEKPDHGHGIDGVTAANTDRLSERILRANLRVENNADEASPSVCLLVLHYDDGRGPFKGMGEVHSAKTSEGKARDPIGVQSPRATAETRAWREAGEKAEATWFRTHASTLDQLATRVRDTHESEKLSRVPERPAEGLDADPMELDALPAGGATVTAEVRTEVEQVEGRKVRHQPNAICAADGDHLAADCKMEKPKS